MGRLTPDNDRFRRAPLFATIAACLALFLPSLPIDVATDRPGAPIRLPLGTGPFYVTFTPNGRSAYVSGFVGGIVVPIDVATRKAGAPIPVGLQADALLMTDDGKTLYVTDLGSSMVTVIDAHTNSVITAYLAGGIGPNGLALGR